MHLDQLRGDTNPARAVSAAHLSMSLKRPTCAGRHPRASGKVSSCSIIRPDLRCHDSPAAPQLDRDHQPMAGTMSAAIKYAMEAASATCGRTASPTPQHGAGSCGTAEAILVRSGPVSECYLRFYLPLRACAHSRNYLQKEDNFESEDNTGPARTDPLGELGHPDRGWSHRTCLG